MKVEHWQLAQRQALPLDAKVELSLRRIRQWCEHWDDQVYVAFSGGLDSTVLLHLVRRVLPDCPAIFCDTGLEYPEIRDFVKTVENVTWLKPEMTFPNVLKKYGFPVVSKRVSQFVEEVKNSKSETNTKRLRLTGINSKGKFNRQGKIPDRWLFLVDAPFKISGRCCDVFKKRPAAKYEAETGRRAFVGTRAEESEQRAHTYYMEGCNGFDMKRPRSTPLTFWLHSDVLDYIERENLPYSKIYDMGYDRTGCAFCMFGAHLNSPNKIQTLEKTHPQLHRYCMEKLGLREVLEHCGIPWRNDQLELFEEE